MNNHNLFYDITKLTTNRSVQLGNNSVRSYYRAVASMRQDEAIDFGPRLTFLKKNATGNA